MNKALASQNREARLAEALRSNLRKRKVQGKSRDVTAEDAQDQAKAITKPAASSCDDT
jgi:hypothetical protein